MSNKTTSKKEVASIPKKAKKTKKPLRKSSVTQIDAIERSAVDAVKANSSRTVRGSSGLANTGTIISYD